MIKMFNYTIALYLERFFAGKQHLGLKHLRVAYRMALTDFTIFRKATL